MNKNDFIQGKNSPGVSSLKLHDLAETSGKDLLIQWGFKFSPFKENKQLRKFWEGKEDCPDLIIEYKGKKAFINWKGKRHQAWQINKHPVASYEKWKEKLNFPMLICFAVFDRADFFKDFRFAVPGIHKYTLCQRKTQDSNDVIEFENDLPEFTKVNVLKYLL